MSKKIILSIDDAGNIYDAQGTYVGINCNAVGFEQETVSETKGKVAELIELKNAGFTAEEIVELRQAGLV